MKQSLGNHLTEITFIGEEIQSYSTRLTKLGVMTKRDLREFVAEVTKKSNNLIELGKHVEKTHLS